MKPRINVVTLAVEDLDRSLAFYRDGMGFPEECIATGDGHVAFHLEADFSLVLFPRAEIARIAGQGEDAPRSTECILSHAAQSKAEVDTILRRADAAGGTVRGQPSDEPWGYSGYFKDPDGHLWEIMWNKAAPSG